jgi:uronate dehydrogenase
MRILITGAAGNLATAVRKELSAAGHKLRLADVKPINDPEGESLLLDVSDGRAVKRAMKGMDAVAHLAYGKLHNDPLDRIATSFDVNAKGTFYLLHAASKLNVKRFVYSSTLSVFGSSAELGEKLWDEHSRVDPREVYALTKYFGEEICRFFAEHRRLSVVCLRFCSLANDEQRRKADAFKPKRKMGARLRGMTTHVNDAARAIHLALTARKIRFEVIHVAADNYGRLTRIEKAEKILGFRPKLKLSRPALKCFTSKRDQSSKGKY